MVSGTFGGTCKVMRFFVTQSLVNQRQSLIDKHGRNFKGVIDECLANEKYDLMRTFLFGRGKINVTETSLVDAYLLFYGKGVGIINMTFGETLQSETITDYQSDLEQATVNAKVLIETFT